MQTPVIARPPVSLNKLIVEDSMKKHPAETFLIATKDEWARRLADMPSMVSVVHGGTAALLRRRNRRRLTAGHSPGHSEHEIEAGC